MNRRSFLSALASLPFVGKLFASESSDERCARFAEDLIKHQTGERVKVIPTNTLDPCPLCEKPFSEEHYLLVSRCRCGKAVRKYRFTRVDRVE